jgi:UDP-3-O-[3-hydroxymyristoyl] glucosamine N-acyltransferase
MMNRLSCSLSQLAELTSSKLIGDPEKIVFGVDSLSNATTDEVSFLANERYKEELKGSKAGLICIDMHMALPPSYLEGKNYLLSENPSDAFQKICLYFLQDQIPSSSFTGIHPTAVIDPSARIGKDVHIGPYVVIDNSVSIGDHTRINAHASIGAGVKIGEDCLIHSHVVLREGSILGNRVVLQPGCIIGSCGFGYITDAQGQHKKMDQMGIVVIEDDVEVGANTCIDRARFKETRIQKGTKIDNLVQIGHNVHIGPANIIVSQSGIAGSSKTGRNVVLGGQTGIVGHIEICDFVMLASRGGFSKSITKPGKYGGGPALPMAEYNRMQVHMRKLDQYAKEIEELKKQIESLKQALPQENTTV